MAQEIRLELVDDGPGNWPDGLVVLYRREYAPMVRLAFTMLGSRSEAEEVVQDAVLRLRDRFSRLASPGAYLRRAVVNGCIGIIRHRQVVDRSPVDPPPDDVPDRLVELHDVLLRLPAQQRAAIVLRHVGGLHDEEIAEALGVRRATVRSLVARGLARLQEDMRRD